MTKQQNQADMEGGLFSINNQWFKVAFYIFLILWGAYILYETMAFDNPQNYLFPYLLLPIIFIGIAIKLIALLWPGVGDQLNFENSTGSSMDQIKEEAKEASEIENSARTKVEREKIELLMIGWVILLPIMIYYLGMGWTIVLYVFGFITFFTRNIKLAALSALGVFIAFLILFIYILNMVVWTGTLGLPDLFELVR